MYEKRDFRPEEHPKRKLKSVSFNSILESPQTILPQFGGGVGGGGRRGSEASYRPRRRPLRWTSVTQEFTQALSYKIVPSPLSPSS